MVTQPSLTRQERAQQIVWKRGAMRRIDANTYIVQSQSGNGEYIVVMTESGWVCACPDNSYRKTVCKHIMAVEISLELRKTVQSHVTVIPEKTLACRFCNSDNIVKKAKRKNKYG